MVWHSVVISNPAKLSSKNGSLTIEQEETARIPFEDIAVIVLNHRAITLTHPVLSACAEHGVGLYSTGKNYQPNGAFMPFLSHSRALQVMRRQLSVDKPTTKRTWQRIVKAKISNQALCLDYAHCDGVDRLRSLIPYVRSGDPANIEGQASGIYFKSLFGGQFVRSTESRTNAALNYGYAIVRGSIARLLVAHGFLPAFGLHHHSEQNAFNLADDLIEPLRPLVDLFVSERIQSDSEILQPSDKALLVELLHYDVQIGIETTSVLSAIEKMVESLGRVLSASKPELIELPALLPLRVHSYEC